MEEKRCGRCRETKPAEEFHKNQGKCKPCQAAYYQEWKAKNREYALQYQRDHYHKNKQRYRDNQRRWNAVNKDRVAAWGRKYNYGLTDEQYQAMLEKQEGRCSICGTAPKSPATKYVLHVDHDHETGHIRGLLCPHCNHGLGKFKDSVELLQKAIDYLKL